MPQVLLFNPRAAKHKPRIPNSILQIAASIEGRYSYTIVDGNLETDPQQKIIEIIEQHQVKIFACTVMPGPQLKQAIPISREIRRRFPSMKIVWGGYFPSNQPEVVLNSGYVDVIVSGMGDKSFPLLVNALLQKSDFNSIPNLIYKRENTFLKTSKDPIYDPNELPDLPYEKLNEHYSLQKYLGKTMLGNRTIAYHSSFGCPFTCSFCGIVPIYNARWKGESAQKIHRNILRIKSKYGGDAIEFHDNNFFVSEKRVIEFCELIRAENMKWWGEARIDTVDKFTDATLQLMYDAGCRMIFFGAETGNDEVLKKMDKGGTQTGEQIIRFAQRIRKFGIIPEYSFVLGLPGKSEQEVITQINEDITFIRKVKEANPDTEIIIYVYSPVPTKDSELFQEISTSGFRFPEKLEDWISPQWESFDLRKNPLTPWLKPYMVDRIRNFEAVLNAKYPTVSDIRLNAWKRVVLRMIGTLRYGLKFYAMPYEIKLLHKLWKYRQPETEGF